MELPLDDIERFRPGLSPQASSEEVVQRLQALERILELFMELTRLSGILHVGQGGPNTVVAAPTGHIYIDELGGAGTTLWVKESSPTPKTGWVGK